MGNLYLQLMAIETRSALALFLHGMSGWLRRCLYFFIYLNNLYDRFKRYNCWWQDTTCSWSECWDPEFRARRWHSVTSVRASSRSPIVRANEATTCSWSSGATSTFQEVLSTSSSADVAATACDCCQCRRTLTRLTVPFGLPCSLLRWSFSAVRRSVFAFEDFFSKTTTTSIIYVVWRSVSSGVLIELKDAFIATKLDNSGLWCYGHSRTIQLNLQLSFCRYKPGFMRLYRPWNLKTAWTKLAVYNSV